MITDSFDDRIDSTVTNGETLADLAVYVDFAVNGSIQQNISADYVGRRVIRGIRWRFHNDPRA
jgi:hypothetical protein